MPTFSILPFLPLLLLLAWPYVQKVKHEDTKPLAAFLVFTSILILITSAIYYVALWVTIWMAPAEAQQVPAFGGWLLALISLMGFLFAFWIADRIVRRRPRHRRPPN
ncbi:hypothetical protein [Pseudokordiimonas caeni]|uniref:hypothetical protein n=1 Tax=Pseudokordiimonas caeni TaxID=2997908 RepID=UPI002811BCCC|nr:hypothetical protein [Pseudokordiimonas caeni]